MNDHQLQCFLCVADKLNFTKAAEELYLSTPTVTHHIKSLEEELDVKLFIRTSKIVKLTEAGTMFYRDAKDILSKIEVSQKRIKKAASQNVSFLSIGCTSNAELNKLQKSLSDLQRIYPNVYPKIIVDDYFSLKNLFNNRQLDVMLATKEMVKDIKNGTFKKLEDTLSYAVVSMASELAGRGELAFADLTESCLIIVHPKFIPFQYGNKLQEKIALHSQNHFNIVCENDQAAILLAKCGYGTAILPEFCIPDNVKDVVRLPVKEENSIEYGLVFQKKGKEDYIRYFIEHFRLEEAE